MEELLSKSVAIFSRDASPLTSQGQFEHLQKLQRFLDFHSKAELVALTGKFETGLVQNVVRAIHVPSVAVRDVLSHVVCAFYEKTLSNSLIDTFIKMQTDMSKRSDAKVTLMHCIGGLALRFDRRISNFLSDTLVFVQRQLRSSEISVRIVAMQCCLNSLKGAQSDISYSIPDVHKVANRAIVDKSSEVRILTAQCLTEVTRFSKNFSELEQFIPHCAKGLSDPESSVRYAFAECLGTSLGLSVLSASAGGDDAVESGAAGDSSTSGSSKSKSKAFQPPKDFFAAFDILHAMFMKAPTPQVRTGLAHACVCLFRSSQLSIEDAQLSKLLQQMLSLLPTGKLSSSPGAAESVSYMLRKGLFASLHEQRSLKAGEQLLKLISGKLTKLQLVTCLTELSFLFHSLGPVAEEMKDAALEPLLPLLGAPVYGVRIRAGQCLLMLAQAAPSQLATLLRILMSVVNMHLSDEDGDDNTMFALHGNAHGLALLVRLIPELECGVPNTLITDAFDVAEKLLDPQSPPKSDLYNSRALLKECGWAIIASLITHGSQWASPHLKTLFGNWKDDLIKKPEDFKPKSKLQAHSEISVRIHATLALRELVNTFKHKMEVYPQFHVPVAKIAAQVLAFVKHLEGFKQYNLEARVTSLIGILMDVYTLLPASAYSKHYVHLLKLAVSVFTIRHPVTASGLEFVLDQRDTSLISSKSSDFLGFQRMLRSYDANMATGELWVPFNYDDSPQQQLQLLESHRSLPFNMHPNAARGVRPPLPFKPRSVACYSAVRLFSTIFPNQNDHHKKQLVEHFYSIVKNASVVPRVDVDQNPFMERLKEVTKSKSSSRETAILENLTCALLLSCDEMLKTRTKFGAAKESVDLIMRIATDLMASANPLVCRAATEIFGTIAKIGSSKVSGQLVQLAGKKLRSKDRSVQAGAALALGAVHSAIGSLKSMQFMAVTVASLQAIGRETDEQLRIRVLHALWKTVDVGGISVSSYIRPTLSMCLFHLVVDTGETTDPSVVRCIGRLVHSVLSAIGPELSDRSESADEISNCLAILEALKFISHPLVRVEYLKCLVQLLQYSPNDVKLSGELAQMIDEALRSPEYQLREVAVQCLRQFAQKRTDDVLRKGVFERLFEALNSEEATSLRDSIRFAVFSISHVVARHQAGQLILLLQSIIEGKPRKVEEDDEEEEAPKSSPKNVDPSEEFRFSTEPQVYRWYTKVCASDLIGDILSVISRVGTPGNAAHFDLKLAKKARKKQAQSSEASRPVEYLVDYLRPLVMLVYRAVTSNEVEIQISGLKNMGTLVELFGQSKDPDLGGQILSQYQAQLSYGVGATISKETHPKVRAFASDTLLALLSNPIAGTLLSKRSIEALVSVLNREDAYIVAFGDIYASHTQSKLMIQHLVTLEKLWHFAKDEDTDRAFFGEQREIIRKILSPELGVIFNASLNALADALVVSSQPAKALRDHMGAFFKGYDCNLVKPLFSAHFTPILRYVSSLLNGDSLVIDSSTRIDLRPPQRFVAVILGVSLRFLSNALLRADPEASKDGQGGAAQILSSTSMTTQAVCIDAIVQVVKSSFFNERSVPPEELSEILVLLVRFSEMLLAAHYSSQYLELAEEIHSNIQQLVSTVASRLSDSYCALPFTVTRSAREPSKSGSTLDASNASTPKVSTGVAGAHLFSHLLQLVLCPIHLALEDDRDFDSVIERSLSSLPLLFSSSSSLSSYAVSHESNGTSDAEPLEHESLESRGTFATVMCVFLRILGEASQSSSSKVLPALDAVLAAHMREGASSSAFPGEVALTLVDEVSAIAEELLSEHPTSDDLSTDVADRVRVLSSAVSVTFRRVSHLETALAENFPDVLSRATSACKRLLEHGSPDIRSQTLIGIGYEVSTAASVSSSRNRLLESLLPDVLRMVQSPREASDVTSALEPLRSLCEDLEGERLSTYFALLLSMFADHLRLQSNAKELANGANGATSLHFDSDGTRDQFLDAIAKFFLSLAAKHREEFKVALQSRVSRDVQATFQTAVTAHTARMAKNPSTRSKKRVGSGGSLRASGSRRSSISSQSSNRSKPDASSDTATASPRGSLSTSVDPPTSADTSSIASVPKKAKKAKKRKSKGKKKRSTGVGSEKLSIDFNKFKS